MPLPVVDWFMTIFFLAALILMARFRRQLVAVDPKSYRELSTGVGLLSLAAMARLYSSLGILRQVPFLSEPVFFQLIVWVIIITGITFLLGGISEWLPLTRSSRESAQKTIARSALFRELEQLGSIEPRPEPFFQTVLAHVIDAHKFSCGAMYSVTARGDRLRFLGAVNCSTYESALAGVTVESEACETANRVLIEGLGSIGGLPPELGRPVYCMPVEVRNRVRGLFLFWSGTVPDQSEILDLKLVSDIVARRILHRSQQIKIDYFESVERLYRRLNRQFVETVSPTDRLTWLVRELRSLIPIDFALLQAGGHHDHQVDRLSVGANGYVLLERNVEPSPALDLLRFDYQFEDTAVAVVDSPLKENLCRELPGDLQSLVVVSMPTGQLILGSERTEVYTPAVLKALEYITPHVRMVLDAYIAQREMSAVENHLTDLAHLTQATSDDLRVSIAEVATYLRETLAVDAVRVSVLDKTGMFLNSLGLASRVSSPAMAPELGSMILTLLPLHARSIESGEAVVWHSGMSAEPLSESEAGAVSAATISTLALIPFGSAAGGIRGLFTIVSGSDCAARLAKDRNRLTLKIAGALLADLLLHVHQPPRLIRRAEKSDLIQHETTHRTEIRSSLTGILGSVELMRSLREPDKGAVEKFLTIIDRSARKIDAYLESPELSTATQARNQHATR
jgi:hypothetical protein